MLDFMLLICFFTFSSSLVALRILEFYESFSLIFATIF